MIETAAFVQLRVCASALPDRLAAIDQLKKEFGANAVWAVAEQGPRLGEQIVNAALAQFDAEIRRVQALKLVEWTNGWDKLMEAWMVARKVEAARDLVCVTARRQGQPDDKASQRGMQKQLTAHAFAKPRQWRLPQMKELLPFIVKIINNHTNKQTKKQRA